MKETLYMKASDKTIAPYVVLSGDPWRVETLKEHLDNPVKVAFSREYNTYTGTYKGMPVTVTSTGIGAPSAAIAMEELYACGMEVALRTGTVMGLTEDLLGSFLVPHASVRRESTSATYVEAGYPAVADTDFVKVLNDTLAIFGERHSNGLNCTVDGFYSQMRESRLAKERGTDIEKTLASFRELGVSGIDMESSTLLVLGKLMGVKTAVLTAVTVLGNLEKTIEGKPRDEMERKLCRIALESMHQLHLRKGELWHGD